VTQPGAPLDRLPYHVGMATCEFDLGKKVLTEAFGFEWESLYHAENLSFMSPGGPVAVNGFVAHSLGGPMRVELCAGSLWPTTATAEVHHYGYWTSAITEDIARFEQHGWTPEVWVVDGAGRPAEFAYLVKPGHPRVELVDVKRHPAYCERVGYDVPISI
jgi:hypothetical protein